MLNENDPAHAEVLSDIKRRFREETFTRESIAQVIHAHSDLVWLSVFYLVCVCRKLTDACLMWIDSIAVCELCDDALSFYR